MTDKCVICDKPDELEQTTNGLMCWNCLDLERDAMTNECIEITEIKQLVEHAKNQGYSEWKKTIDKIDKLRELISKSKGGLTVLVCMDCGFVSGSEFEFEEHVAHSGNVDCRGVHYG